VAAAGVGFFGLNNKVSNRLEKAVALGAERVIWLPPLRGVVGWDRLDRELEELLAAASSHGTAVSCHVHTGTIVEDLADAKDLVRRFRPSRSLSRYRP